MTANYIRIIFIVFLGGPSDETLTGTADRTKKETAETVSVSIINSFDYSTALFVIKVLESVLFEANPVLPIWIQLISRMNHLWLYGRRWCRPLWAKCRINLRLSFKYNKCQVYLYNKHSSISIVKFFVVLI